MTTTAPRKLSAHFDTREFTRSQTAARLGIDNSMPPDVEARARVTCEKLMEPIRVLAGNKSVMVTSGYRSPALNKQVGGNEKGQHPRGEAVDFEVPGVDNLEMARRIAASDLPFDQLILEAYTHGDPSSGWIHVSHRQDGKPQRREVLTAYVKAGGGMRYEAGLPK
jgi:hypothetical protein